MSADAASVRIIELTSKCVHPLRICDAVVIREGNNLRYTRFNSGIAGYGYP